jgi:hypothetical protein
MSNKLSQIQFATRVINVESELHPTVARLEVPLLKGTPGVSDLGGRSFNRLPEGLAVEQPRKEPRAKGVPGEDQEKDLLPIGILERTIALRAVPLSYDPGIVESNYPTSRDRTLLASTTVAARRLDQVCLMGCNLMAKSSTCGFASRS